MVWFAYTAVLIGILMLGFLAGLLTFKRTLQWCRECGAQLTCPRRCGGHRCAARPSSVGAGTDTVRTP